MAKSKDPSQNFGNETNVETRAKKFVLNAFTKFSDRSGLEAQWEKYDKLYNCISTEKFYDGVADLFPPETRKACKTLVNFIDETILTNPKFQIRGVGGLGDSEKAQALHTLIEWQQEKNKLRSKLRRMLERYLVKYGIAIIKVVWSVNEKYALSDIKERKKLKLKIKGEIDEEIIHEIKSIYDNVDFQVKDIHSIYWNYFQEWDKQKIIIERTIVDENHLRVLEKLGIYYGIDRVLNKETTKRQIDEKIVAEKYGHIKDLTGLSGNFNINEKEYELLEAWCSFDIDNDGIEEECIIVIADREFVIRVEPNPYDVQEKPYLWVCWEGIEGTSLGMGVPQIAEKSQVALNDFTNQIMDNITAILDCMKIVDDLAEIPDLQLKSRPNGIIRSKTGTEAVKFIRPELTANEGLKAVAMVKDDIRTGTGATMSLQGLPARYGTTAFEYQAQGTASSRDIFAKLRDIEDYILKEFYRRCYEYDLQYMSREEFIKIVGDKAANSLLGTAVEGEDFKEVREVIRGDWDFIPLGVTELENKIIKGQQIMNFLNLVGKLPPGIVDIAKLVDKVWQYVGDGDNIILPQPTTKFISPDDENILINQGESPTVKPMENHVIHIIVHQQAKIPIEYEPIRYRHIQEHQNILNLMQAQQMTQGGGLLPPQEQPRLRPDLETPKTAGIVPGLPIETI
ncbi:MAG: hypothetical protein AB1668_07105 [Nanoarchaeota archaeon]